MGMRVSLTERVSIETGGTVVDGSGAPMRAADIGVRLCSIAAFQTRAGTRRLSSTIRRMKPDGTGREIVLAWNVRTNPSSTGSVSALTASASSATAGVRAVHADPMSTSRVTRVGARSAIRRATKLPIECPMMVALAMFIASMNWTASAAK